MIRRNCNPRKSAELNPYWVDFFEKGGDRDALTWGGDGGFEEYDKGIRNSVCGGGGGGGKEDDDGEEMYGPFNMDGFTKGSKSTTGTTTMGEGFGIATTGTGTSTTTRTSSSSLFPGGESSLGSVDDGTTTTPPLLSSTSPDEEDTGKVIDTSSSFFFSAAAAPSSSASIALQDSNINNNNKDGQDTIRFDSKLFTRRRTRKRVVGLFS